MATTAKIAKEAKTPKLQDPPPQPLPAVRAAARLHPEVRDVPPVLPQVRARGRHHGSDEEQLVNPNAQIPNPKSHRFGFAWDLGFGAGFGI